MTSRAAMDTREDESKSSAPSDGRDSHSAATDVREQRQMLFKRYHERLVSGCGSSRCDNPNCASNPSARALTPKDAFVPALKLLSEHARLCEPEQSVFYSSSSSSFSDPVSIPLESPVLSPQQSSSSLHAPTPISTTPGTGISNSVTSLLAPMRPARLGSSVMDLMSQTMSHGEVQKILGNPPNPHAISPLSSSPAPSLVGKQTAESIKINDFLKLVFDARATGEKRILIRYIGQTFSNFDTLNASFFTSTSVNLEEECGVDLEAVDRVYEALAEMEDEAVLGVLANTIQRLCQSLVTSPTKHFPPASLRAFLILLNNSLWFDSERYVAFRILCQNIDRLSEDNFKTLTKWVSHLNRERLEKFVAIIQQYITVRMYTMERMTDVSYAVKVLTLVHDANQLNEAEEKDSRDVIPYNSFYNDAVNESRDLNADYRCWRQKSGFSFVNHPFIMDPGTKARLLQLDATVQMRHHMEEAMMRSMFHQRTIPYLVLRVRRDNLVQDTLLQLQQKSSFDLKKPLKVQFIGEDGIDEGGVQKEFFQILMASLFDAEYGMFTYDAEQRLFWFNQHSLESGSEFELIGNLLGLAIYNSVILDIRFPSVVYKLLMGLKPTLADLIEAQPELGKGLKQLLTFEGDVESTYCRTFSVNYEVWGEAKLAELKPGGESVPLTNFNRAEYVELYVDYILIKSVAKQFNAFREGFMNVAGGDALKIFRWEELEMLICGSPLLDFDALEKATRYEDGFTRKSQTIINFWEIVHKWPEEFKRKLLFFSTGSDRVPIKGLGTLSFTISKNGPDSDRLPTSHTCFNHLLIPDYSTKEKLQANLLLAIENYKGFGTI